MKVRSLLGLVLFLAAAALSGCGGGGGAVDPNAPAAVTLTSARSVALGDGIDAITLQTDVRKGDGSAVADGTPVAFSVNTGTLSAPTATTTNGIASVTLTHSIPGTATQTVTVTCRSGNAVGTLDVKFIRQPASADVFIAFNPAVTNLAALNFKLKNSAGASFNNAAQPQLISALNAATTGSGSLVVGNFNAADNSNNIGLVNANANGFDTGSLPIIKVTYAISTGVPTFSVDTVPANFTATDINGGATTPAVTAANMVVTVTYDTEL